MIRCECLLVKPSEVEVSAGKDNLKETLNKYDSIGHERRMEAMQRSIQNAAETTAVEAAKQTAYAKETAKSAKQAAVASTITAYNTRQIDKNTRGLR